MSRPYLLYHSQLLLRLGVFSAAGFAAGVVLLSANAAEAATLALSPSTGFHTVGTTFSVDVLLNTEDIGVDGVDIRYLNYDPLLLEVIDEDSGTAGVQITAGSLMPNTLANTVDTANGRISLSQVATGGTTFTNSTGQTLATVRFRVLGIGTSTVAFTFTPGSTADTNVAFAGTEVLTAVTNGTFSLVASAPVTIFSDNFETTLAWTQTGDVAWYTGSPKNGTHAARLRTTGSIERPVSLTGYQNITVSFSMGANSLDNSNENLQALYFDGLAWQVLAQIVNGSVHENNSLNAYALTLPAKVNNLATFALRFKLNGSSTNDSGYVDDVVLRGMPFVAQGSIHATSGIAMGDRVSATANLNVRSGPSLTTAKVATQPMGTAGTFIAGPVVADGYTWWQVDYDPAAGGVGDGWSIEPYLAKLYPVLLEVGMNESDEGEDQGVLDKLLAEIMNLQAQVSSVASQLAGLAVSEQ
jgi:hypothetical protein